ECKNWTEPLRSSDINCIRAEYAAAKDSGDIQVLYIIANKDVSASVRESIKGTPWLTFLTFDQFQTGIIDFSSYLAHLVSDFDRPGLSSYYVPSRLLDGTLLHNHVVIPWLANSAAKSLAIVAGYGMGKTSYSRFLATELAKQAQAQPSSRVPILVSLSSLVQQ